MRFPSDDELMAGPNAFGDARIEVAPDAADPEADARAQIDAGLVDETEAEAGAELGDDEDSEDSEEDEEYEDLEGLEDEEDADLDAFEALTSLASLREDAAATIEMPDFPEDFRAGFVSIVGRLLTKGANKADQAEQDHNPRSASVRLRGAELIREWKDLA